MRTTIYFKYGAMNSGKSLELIKIAYNYEQNKIKPLILKAKIDTRIKGEIYSRTGLKIKSYEIGDNVEEIEKLITEETKVILIDESQFLNPEVIEKIVALSYKFNVEAVMFFGLKADFRGELFPGSKKIIELCDKLEESTSICWCGKKARQNARIVNNKITKQGPTILVDDANTKVEYTTLCNYHYYFEQLGE